MSRVITRDGTAYCRADQIAVGDGLDLQGDLYADPDTYADPAFEPEPGSTPDGFRYELAEVWSIELEPHDVDPVIVLETSLGTFGFPVDHEIEVGLFADTRTDPLPS